MADIRELVRTVHATPGVRGAAVVGRDGLLIDVAGLAPDVAEHVAALAPGLSSAAEMMADAAAAGAVRALVVEGAGGLVLAMPLSAEVALLALLGPADGDGGAAPDGAADEGATVGAALYALRRARGRFAAQA